MRVLVAVAAALLLAGCVTGAPDAPPEAEPAVIPDDPDLPFVTGTNGTTRTYGLDVTGLAFEDHLQRFAVVADGNASVRLDIDGLLASYGAEDGCLALGAYSRTADDETTGALAHAVMWQMDFDLDAAVEAAGLRHQVLNDPYAPYDAAVGVRLGGPVGGNLTAGERFVVEVGARSARVFESGVSSYGPSYLDLNLTVDGAAHVVRLPDGALRCGVGARQAEEAFVRVETMFGGEAMVGGHLALDAAAGATMLWSGSSWAGSATLTFGAEEMPATGQVARTSDDPVAMAVTFDTWASPVGSSGAWLLADTHWPSVAHREA